MDDYVDVPLDGLELNPTNPRLDVSSNDQDALEELLNLQGPKLLALATDIAANGLNPSEHIVVGPSPHDNGKLIVHEGNRRIAALKLLTDPGLAAAGGSQAETAFRELSEKHRGNIQKTVRAYRTEDEAEINRLMQLKHTGEQGGKGVVKWGSAETARFNERIGLGPTAAHALLSHLVERGLMDEGWAKESGIGVSNLNRILSYAKPKKALGISGAGKNLDFRRLNEKRTARLLEDMSSDSFNVGRIYRKTDAESYISELFGIGPDEWDRPDDATEPGSPETTACPAPALRHSQPSFPAIRTTVAVKGQSMPIGNARAVKVFTELKKLNADDFPNAAAVLLRTFIEMSCDEYMENVDVDANESSTLSVKIKATAHRLYADGEIDDGCKQAVNLIRSESRESDSINVATLHAFVHSRSIQPDPSMLKGLWENIFPYLKALWGNCP